MMPPSLGNGRLEIELETIRDAFPALRRVEQGYPVAYFDGPGGTQVPRVVVDAMAEYLLHRNANTHWAYPTSVETDEAIAAAREAMADLLGAGAGEIVFGANMTTLTFHLSRALGRAWGAGDEIVVTELDHHANIAPWQALARERGVVLRTVPFDPVTGELVWDALAAAIGPRTRLVAIGAASNALGTITDVSRAAALARERGALSFVDAVHFAAHEVVDVSTIGCDFLACSAYKFYGPHLGILFGRQEVMARLDLPKLQPAPDTPPESLELGTQNHEGIVGTHAAVEFRASFGKGMDRRTRLQDAGRRFQRHGQELIERLWQGLSRLPHVQLYGPPPERPRTPTVAFSVRGHSAEAVARHLARYGVFVSHGDFYALTVIQRLGLGPDGVVRAGCACYTTRSEVDRLLHHVAELRNGVD